MAMAMAMAMALNPSNKRYMTNLLLYIRVIWLSMTGYFKKEHTWGILLGYSTVHKSTFNWALPTLIIERNKREHQTADSKNQKPPCQQQ